MNVFFTISCFKVWLRISALQSFDHWILWPLDEWLISRLWNALQVPFLTRWQRASDGEESIFSDLANLLVLDDISTFLKVNAFCYWFGRQVQIYPHWIEIWSNIIFQKYFKFPCACYVPLTYNYSFVFRGIIGGPLVQPLAVKACSLDQVTKWIVQSHFTVWVLPPQPLSGQPASKLGCFSG